MDDDHIGFIPGSKLVNIRKSKKKKKERKIKSFSVTHLLMD